MKFKPDTAGGVRFDGAKCDYWQDSQSHCLRNTRALCRHGSAFNLGCDEYLYSVESRLRGPLDLPPLFLSVPPETRLKGSSVSQQNPFSVPSTFGETAVEPITQQAFGGIGRLAYFGYSVLNSIVSQVLTIAVVSALPAEAAPVALVIAALSMVAAIVITVLRLKNLGNSGWWVLGLIVPILNLIIAIKLIAAPEGYALHKTLDTPGKVIVGLMLGLIVLVVVVVVLAS